MDKIDEFTKSLPDERCRRCDFARCITANGHFKFLGCTHPPIRASKDCPKTQREDGENHAD